MTVSYAAMILAAGLGKRMRSKLPKVMHRCCDVPLITHVINTALAQQCSPIVVVLSPHSSHEIQTYLKAEFPHAPLKFAIQHQPLGTGDAAKAGLTQLENFKGKVLILYGDVPLLTSETLQQLFKASMQTPVGFLTAHVDDPKGYGRVVRDQQQVVKIVEHRDASAAELDIHEINAGIYLCDKTFLENALTQIRSNNDQHEFYLTDIVGLAPLKIAVLADAQEILGVNSVKELMHVERLLQQRLLEKHLNNGARFLDVLNIFIGTEVQIAQDVTIGFGVQLYGKTIIEEGVNIEGPTVIRDCVIRKNATIAAFSHLEKADVGEHAHVGPFARLRPEAILKEHSRVGNFVEIKKSILGKNSKANHLTYLGDANVGENSNIGAGTITCNYDGFHKHPTAIGESVFIGSNSTLIAPLTIEDGAFVAAGSTITQNVGKDTLAFGRAQQKNREGYAVKLKNRLKKDV